MHESCSRPLCIHARAIELHDGMEFKVLVMMRERPKCIRVKVATLARNWRARVQSNTKQHKELQRNSSCPTARARSAAWHCARTVGAKALKMGQNMMLGWCAVREGVNACMSGGYRRADKCMGDGRRRTCPRCANREGTVCTRCLRRSAK